MNINFEKFACQKCNQQFKHKSSLTTHNKTSKCGKNETKIPKKFICSFCEKELASKQMLEYHISSFHSIEKQRQETKKDISSISETLHAEITNNVLKKLQLDFYQYINLLQTENKKLMADMTYNYMLKLEQEHENLLKSTHGMREETSTPQNTHIKTLLQELELIKKELQDFKSNSISQNITFSSKKSETSK